MANETNVEDQKTPYTEDKKDLLNKSILNLKLGDLRDAEQRRNQSMQNRRQRAKQREQSFNDRITTAPTEIEASDINLIPKAIRHATKYYNVQATIDDPFILDAILTTFRRLDECYSFFAYSVPSKITNREITEQITKYIEARFKELTQAIENRSVQLSRYSKSVGISLSSLDQDKTVQRVTPSPIVNFKISSPQTVKLLKLCEKIDSILSMEQFLCMNGLFDESQKIADSRALNYNIRQYANSIFKFRQEISSRIARLEKEKKTPTDNNEVEKNKVVTETPTQPEAQTEDQAVAQE